MFSVDLTRYESCGFFHFDIMAMNFYTWLREQLAALEKVGAATADKLIDLRDETITGLRDPLTVQDLSNIRLKAD